MKHIIRRIKNISFCLALMCAMIFAMPMQALAAVEVNVGGEFMASFVVEIDKQEDIKSYNMVIKYDPSLLLYVSGDGSDSGGSIVVSRNLEDSSVSSQVISLRFRAIAEGETEVYTDSKEFYDSNSRKIQLVAKNENLHVVIGPANPETIPAGETHAMTEAPPQTMPETPAPTMGQTTAQRASSDAGLRSLSLSNGVLDPTFSPDVFAYTVTIPSEVSDIEVSAEPNSSEATYSVSGNSNLSVGRNTIICEVIAGDKVSIQRYTITVNKRDDAPLDIGDTGEPETEPFTPTLSNATVKVNESIYKIATFAENSIPAGFSEGTYNYNGEEVQAAVNADGTMLLNLIGNSEEVINGFYIYDPVNDSWQNFAELTVPTASISILPLELGTAVPDNLEECTLKIKGVKVRGWTQTGDTEKRFCVIYGMNKDGEKGFYYYDINKKTFQDYHNATVVKYTEGGAVVDSAEYYDLLGRYSGQRKVMAMVIIFSLIAVAAALLVWRRTRRELMLVYEELDTLETEEGNYPSWYNEAMNADLIDAPGEDWKEAPKEFDPDHIEDYDEDEIYDAFLNGKISISSDFSAEEYKKLMLGQESPAPEAETPAQEEPETEAPAQETPEAETPETEAETPASNEPETEEPETNEPETNETESEE